MADENGDSTVGLAIGAAALAFLFFLGATLVRDIDFDALFGVEAWRGAGVGGLLAAFGLLLALLLSPGLAGGAVRVLGRLIGAVPAPVRLPLLLVVSATVFWLLPTFKLSGDAVPVVIRTSLGEIYASNPLTSFLSVGISRVLYWPSVPAIRLLSCASGVLFVFSAVKIARECFPAGPARSGFAVVLVCSGTSVLFFGSIEVYAPLAAFLGLYLFLGIRTLARGGSIVWPAMVLGVAFTLHGSAGLLLPSLVVLANAGRIRPLRFKRQLLAAGSFLIPVVLVFGALFLLVWGGELPDASPERFGSFFGGNDQGPLLPLVLTPTNVLYRYALFDAEHLVGVLNLLFLAAPAGMILLLIGRPAPGNPVVRFVGLAALFLVLFPVFWNVNYPLRQDWDLFSPLGIPLTVLGALAFLRRGAGPRRAVGAAALALFAFVPAVFAARGDHYDRRLCLKDLHAATQTVGSIVPKEQAGRRRLNARAGERYLAEIERNDPFGAERKVDLAMAAARSGQLPLKAVEDRLLEVLKREPRNARAAEGLGSILLARRKFEDARPYLVAALREEPWRLPSRMNLARIALADGDAGLAIRQLESGLRRGSTHPYAGQALLELAELHSRRREEEIATKLRELAAARGPTPR